MVPSDMAVQLERTERYARDYWESERGAWERVGAWERIKVEHDLAMIAFDVEDLIDLGFYVISMWLRHAEQWHELVSGNPKLYSEDTHRQLRSIEAIVVEATEGTLKLIDKMKKLDCDFTREGQYTELAIRVIGATKPIPDRPRDESFDEFRKSALDEHRQGKTIPIGHWGE